MKRHSLLLGLSAAVLLALPAQSQAFFGFFGGGFSFGAGGGLGGWGGPGWWGPRYWGGPGWRRGGYGYGPYAWGWYRPWRWHHWGYPYAGYPYGRGLIPQYSYLPQVVVPVAPAPAKTEEK